MDVGIQTLFSSHGWPGIRDSQVYDEDTTLALLAEELGFDVVWAVEHHFYDYSFCPDNTEWLAYVKAQPSLGVPSLYYLTALFPTYEPITDEDWNELAGTWR